MELSTEKDDNRGAHIILISDPHNFHSRPCHFAQSSPRAVLFHDDFDDITNQTLEMVNDFMTPKFCSKTRLQLLFSWKEFLRIKLLQKQ